MVCGRRGELASGVGSEDQGVITTICAILELRLGSGVTICDHPKASGDSDHMHC